MKLSIVTPNYNYANFIEKTILSVVEQEVESLEYIIVDDGSTDNSVEIIKKLQHKYPSVIKLLEQENKGQTPAINEGLKHVTGDIIGWINSDDLYCQNALKNVVYYFKKNRSTDVIFSDTFVTNLDGKNLYKKRFLNYNNYFGIFFGYANIMSSNTVFFKRELLEKTGFLQSNLKCNMDGEFFSRLCRQARVKKVGTPLAKFRRQPYTKASEKHKNWGKLVKREVQEEKQASYATLKISNLVPFKYVYLISFWFRLIRVISRLILGHYVLEFLEKKHLKQI